MSGTDTIIKLLGQCQLLNLLESWNITIFKTTMSGPAFVWLNCKGEGSSTVLTGQETEFQFGFGVVMNKGQIIK